MDGADYGASTPPSFLLQREEDMEMMDFLDFDEYGPKGTDAGFDQNNLEILPSDHHAFMTPNVSSTASSTVSPDYREQQPSMGHFSMDVWPMQREEQPSTMSMGHLIPPAFATNSNGVNNNSNYSSNDSYNAAQAQLSSLTFGRIYDNSLAVETSLRHSVQPTEDWVKVLQSTDLASYKYNLFIGGLPLRSRVETQIKCRLVLSPGPPQHLLHLPWDAISRPRFQLREKFVPTSNILQLEVDVVSASNPRQQIYMCDKCLNREKKRAFRKKNLDQSEERYWSESRLRRLAIFNCKEVVSIPLEKSCAVDNNQIVQGREIHLPLRLACYSRHHAAKNGYLVIFTVRDHEGTIVARTVTNPILISDDNKEIKVSEDGSISSISAGAVSGGAPSSNNPIALSTTDQSPLSMEDSSEFSSSSVKRRRESDWAGNIRPQLPNSNFQLFSSNTNINRPKASSVKMEMSSPNASNTTPLVARVPSYTNISPGSSSAAPFTPQIQRVIPSQGSVRGGVEVTLLGTGFQSGLVAMFGDVRSSSTQCWSDSTIVTQLPPSPTSGPVVVSFEGYTHAVLQFFTYIDDTDRQLIELALQVVGLKMNGKLEDARNIAMRIVGSKDQSGNNEGQSMLERGGPGFGRSNNPQENVILRCIEIAVVEENKMPNWQVRNNEGQTMMHLAAALGYSKIIVALVSQGARVDLPDVNGMTPLHFAALNGHRLVVQQLLRCSTNPYSRTFAGFTVMDIAHECVTDLLPMGMRYRDYQELIRDVRSSSSSTLSSIMSNDDRMREFTPYDGLARTASGVSILNSYDLSDEDWGLTSSSESEEDVLGDVRTAMRARRASEKPGEEIRFLEHLGHGVDEANPDLGVRVSNAAENISQYISQLTLNAKNKIHWDNWDDVFNYLYRRRETGRHILIDTADGGSSSAETVHPSASDSDATVAPRTSSGKSSQVFWRRYFKSPPPRYDEIFPDRRSDAEEKFQPIDQQPEVVDEQVNYEQQFLQMFINNRKQLRNDRMLFFFWLPVLLVTVLVFGLRIAGYSPEEQFADFGNRTREMASYMILGRKAVQTAQQA